VRAGATSIEDIGTTFAVRIDGDDEVGVVVTAGSVRVEPQGADQPKGGKPQPQVLKAGDRASVGRDGHIERSSAKPDDIAWTSGRLVFDNAPVSQVRADVRRWYGIELQLGDSTLAGRHLTASFSGEPVDQVLRVIGLALGARIERRGDTAVVVRAR
jgi:transmembrane sensor